MEEELIIEEEVEEEELQIEEEEINVITNKDYEKLNNKPKINGIELIGDKSSEDLNIFTYRQLHTTIDGTKVHIRDEEENILSFQEVVDLYLDPHIFVYCLSLNVVHIPAFNETNAMAFMGSYNYAGATHLSRVIINYMEDVQLNDIEVEDADNKSTRIDARSTHMQYPTSKAVYDKIKSINDNIDEQQQDISNLDIEVENLINNTNEITKDYDTLNAELLEQEETLNHLDDIKADKETTYTKQQVDELIGSIENVKIQIVEDLPEIGQTNVIYFVHRPDTQFDDVYNEYIWENNQYELIGNTAIDLSNYYTKEENDENLKGYATTSSLIAGINSCEPKMNDAVDYIIETGTYGNGESGYVKWRKGRIEQWGVATTNANETEFTMHKPHKDQNFSIFIEPREQGNFYHYAIPSGLQKFKTRIQSRDSVSMALKFQWRSYGYWK